MNRVPGKHGQRLRRVIWAAVTILGMILAIRLGEWQGNKAEIKTHFTELHAKRQRQPAHTALPEQWEAWSKEAPDNWRLLSINFSATPLVQPPVYQWHAYKGQWGRCLFGVLLIKPGYGLVAKIDWVPETLDSTAPAKWPEQFSSNKISAWSGQLYVPEKRWILTSSDTVSPGQAIERLDLAELEKAYQLKLFPGVLEIPPQNEGCKMQIPTSEGIQKHRSYQYQWYAIALVMGVLYGIYGWRRGSK